MYREDGAGKTYSWGDDTFATETGEWDLAEEQLIRWPDGDLLAGMMRCASLAYSRRDGGAILLGADSLVDGAGECPEPTEPTARYYRVE